MTVTREEIARLRAMEAMATPGPWESHDGGATVCHISEPVWHLCTPLMELGINESNNAEFVAESRNAMPALLDEIERLRADLREALALLGESTERLLWASDDSSFAWLRRRDKMLAKHKEEA